MIQQLIANGFVEEAYIEIRPMIDRVIKNKGFYEWYQVDGKPNGSGALKFSWNSCKSYKNAERMGRIDYNTSCTLILL